jgi:hypothetical protein
MCISQSMTVFMTAGLPITADITYMLLAGHGGPRVGRLSVAHPPGDGLRGLLRAALRAPHTSSAGRQSANKSANTLPPGRVCSQWTRHESAVSLHGAPGGT